MLGNVCTRRHDMDLALWYIVMLGDICRSPFAHCHDFNAARIALPLHRQRVTLCPFVDVRSIECCVIVEIFIEGAVDIAVRFDTKSLAALKKMRTEELKIVNDDRIPKRW